MHKEEHKNANFVAVFMEIQSNLTNILKFYRYFEKTLERQPSMMGSHERTINVRKSDGLLTLKGFFFPSIIYPLVRIALSAIFLWSGISKLMAIDKFVVIIEGYGLLPDNWIMLVAVALSLLEVVAGLGLLADIHGSLAVIAGLLGVFIVILGYGIWMGLDVDCGCFGPEDPEAKAFHGLRSALVRDIIMMLGIFFLYWWRYRLKIVPKPLTHIFLKFL